MRRAAKVDTTHKAIVEGLRVAGVTVFDTSRLGDGFPDLVCYHRERWQPVEVKTKRTQGEDTFKSGKLKKPYRLTKSQEQQTVPIPIVTSVSEALALFGIEL